MNLFSSAAWGRLKNWTENQTKTISNEVLSTANKVTAQTYISYCHMQQQMENPTLVFFWVGRSPVPHLKKRRISFCRISFGGMCFEREQLFFFFFFLFTVKMMNDETIKILNRVNMPVLVLDDYDRWARDTANIQSMKPMHTQHCPYTT